jgi:hypothetical protein
MHLMNFDSLIFPYETSNNNTILIIVQGPLSASVFLWIIIQCCFAIFKFVEPHRYFPSVENVVALNTL